MLSLFYLLVGHVQKSTIVIRKNVNKNWIFKCHAQLHENIENELRERLILYYFTI